MERRRAGWVAGILGILLLASSCERPVPRLSVRITPEAGHPPFEARIVATDMGGGRYTLVTDAGSIAQTDPAFTVEIDSAPWTATMRWESGRGQAREAAVRIELLNAAPIVGPPRIAPSADWFLQPRERTLLDFNFYEGFMGQGTSGIRDPDGDAWRIVDVRVVCSEKGYPDSIFVPPYEPGVFHALWHGQLIENAVIVYPTYTSAPDEATGLPYPLQYEEGYPSDVFLRDHGLETGNMPEQEATVTVTVEDEWGGRTTASFTVTVAALVFRNGSGG